LQARAHGGYPVPQTRSLQNTTNNIQFSVYCRIGDSLLDPRAHIGEYVFSNDLSKPDRSKVFLRFTRPLSFRDKRLRRHARPFFFEPSINSVRKRQSSTSSRCLL